MGVIEEILLMMNTLCFDKLLNNIDCETSLISMPMVQFLHASFCQGD